MTGAGAPLHIPEWNAACAEINRKWLELTGVSKGYGKQPSHPPRPKCPLKPKMTASDLSTIVEGDRAQCQAGEEEDEEEEEELVNSLRAFEISHFVKVSVSLRFCHMLSHCHNTY